MCGHENMESIYGDNTKLLYNYVVCSPIAPLLVSKKTEVINGLAWALSHNTRLVYQFVTFELAAIWKFPTINGHQSNFCCTVACIPRKAMYERASSLACTGSAKHGLS